MASIQKLIRHRIDPTTGKHKQVTRYRVFIRKKGMPAVTEIFNTKKLAQDFAARIEGDREALRAYGNNAVRSMTLGELIDRFIAQYHKPDTGILYHLRWWKAHYGDRRLVEMDRATVKQALAEVAKGRARHGNGKGRSKALDKPRSPATVNRYKAALSSLFEFGKDEIDLASNPCREIKARPEDNARIRFLSEEERQRLLMACRMSQWKPLYLLVSLAITTGARLGELLQLKWSDIDLKSRRAYVAKTKNGQPRVLPLTNHVVDELMRFRAIGDTLVFPNRNFRPYWKKALEKAGITDFRFHDLRHTAASILAMNGASLIEIGAVLGHKTAAMTQRYSHLCIDHKQALIDNVMGDVLGAGRD